MMRTTLSACSYDNITRNVARYRDLITRTFSLTLSTIVCMLQHKTHRHTDRGVLRYGTL